QGLAHDRPGDAEALAELLLGRQLAVPRKLAALDAAQHVAIEDIAQSWTLGHRNPLPRADLIACRQDYTLCRNAESPAIPLNGTIARHPAAFAAMAERHRPFHMSVDM